jgi:hypothetical protein
MNIQLIGCGGILAIRSMSLFLGDAHWNIEVSQLLVVTLVTLTTYEAEKFKAREGK